jgi:threonine/homoserine/homoserine lactone efflux protein
MLIGFIAGFLASVFGWQINLIAIQKGIDRHKWAPFLVGMGAASADLVFIYCYFTGANLLLYNPRWWTALKWIGIVTIFGLALRLLLRKPKTLDLPAGKQPGAKRYFLLGFIVVIANPAVFLLWLGVMSFILTHFPQLKNRPEEWFFMGGFFLGAGAWFIILVFQMQRIVKNLVHPKHLLWIARGTAVLLFCACLFLVFKNF